MLLGDALAGALAAVGVTEQKVARWLGAPCNCPERRAKLNALDAAVRRAAGGKLKSARDYVLELLKD
jgi:hypothetical protein